MAQLRLVRFMRVRIAKVLLAVSALSLVGCYTDRYQWNLAHATVTAKPPLSRHDIEEITRLVTRATLSRYSPSSVSRTFGDTSRCQLPQLRALGPLMSSCWRRSEQNGTLLRTSSPWIAKNLTKRWSLYLL